MSRARCMRERPVVGIARIGERGRRIEPVARLDVHEPRADPGVDLEHARERDLAADRGDRVDGARVVRERASRVPGSTTNRCSAPATNAASADAKPRVRGERRLDVGAVARDRTRRREHDDGRTAALLDRLGDESASPHA